NTYLAALYTHIICAVLSIAFFSIRGIWMITDNDLLQHKIVKIAPHCIDFILLLAAIALSILISQYPAVHTWLTVKVVALVIYILLGTIALKRGKTKQQRIVCFSLALVTFAFIVSVAYYRHPLGALYLLGQLS
ncbi:MAG TPA: SirB2 family protein, partial [Pseudomonadales bacterium]|nr:SirB2 family protein [Pseudomonadales bacterium]